MSNKTISLYSRAPRGEITLDEFESYAYDRLAVLQDIEFLQNEAKVNVKEKAARIGELLQKYNLTLSTKESKRKDLISHFALRLPFCRNKEDRLWFMKYELALLRHRLEAENDISKLMKDNGVEYEVVGEEEFKSKKEDLSASMNLSNQLSSLRATHFFKVPFEDAIDLVARRNVLLDKGTAYVHKSGLVAILLNYFRAQLSKALLITSKAGLSHTNQNQRVAEMAANITRNQFAGKDFKVESVAGEIRATDVDFYAKRDFPLCMRNLHTSLRQNHHLRHFGRMQYGLFLKGIGVKLDEAIKFWKSEFTKKMPEQKFDKEYKYNIRHNYGEEGRRKDYTPYGCNKIINSNVAVDDAHGCPFKHFQEARLKKELTQLEVPNSTIDDIITTVKNHHYQIACRKYFEATHPGCEKGVNFNHPNHYFATSINYYEAKNNVNQKQAK